jgi:hypothetical protein
MTRRRCILAPQVDLQGVLDAIGQAVAQVEILMAYCKRFHQRLQQSDAKAKRGSLWRRLIFGRDGGLVGPWLLQAPFPWVRRYVPQRSPGDDRGTRPRRPQWDRVPVSQPDGARSVWWVGARREARLSINM